MTSRPRLGRGTFGAPAESDQQAPGAAGMMPCAALMGMLAAYMPTSSPRLGSAMVQRRAFLVLNEAPVKSDDQYDYFRRPKDIVVSLPKPLGAVLESASPAGVVVADLSSEGSASSTGLLKKGDRVISVMGTDVSALSFDEVMQLLTSAPDEVELGVTRNVITRRERVPAAGATGGFGQAPQSKLDKKFDQNFGTAEKTAKTLTKVAKITTAAQTWKNPIYFWAVAGTALLFVPILWYSFSK